MARSGDEKLRPVIERGLQPLLGSRFGGGTLVQRAVHAALAAFKVQVGRPVKMQFAERAGSADSSSRSWGSVRRRAEVRRFPLPGPQERVRASASSRAIRKTRRRCFPTSSAAVRDAVSGRSARSSKARRSGSIPHTGDVHPFQVTVQRKRKHGIAERQAAYPLRLQRLRRCSMSTARIMTPLPYRERRARTRALVKPDPALAAAPAPITRRCGGDRAVLRRPNHRTVSKASSPSGSTRLRGREAKFQLDQVQARVSRVAEDTVRSGDRRVLRGPRQAGDARDRRGARRGLRHEVRSVPDAGQSRERPERRRVDRAPQASRETRVEQPAGPSRQPHRAAVLGRADAVIEVFADEITRSPVHTAGRSAPTDGADGLRAPLPTDRPRHQGGSAPEDATTENEVRAPVHAPEARRGRRRASGSRGPAFVIDRSRRPGPILLKAFLHSFLGRGFPAGCSPSR